MIIKKYYYDRGDLKCNKIIVFDFVYGINFVFVMVVGFDVVEVKFNLDGIINVEFLKEVLDDIVVGLMLINFNIVGMFEKDILEVVDFIYDCGGLFYYDGVNFNVLLGIVCFGDMGFDIIYLNLYKIFFILYGGGGLGLGLVGVKDFLKDYLLGFVVYKEGSIYYFEIFKEIIGVLLVFYGNVFVYLRVYVYIRMFGEEYLGKIGLFVMLNVNYIKESLKYLFKLFIKVYVMYEFVFDGLID